ncbi:hypothetical protein J4434_03295 [Candidatus Woesearchaeota archaeon]|nr:hypothetical protein [Candidatus Woesearchaeota archaeon]
MPQTLEETLETSPLIYVKESKKVDGKEVKVFGFVHDTYRDFFIAKYFADEINEGRLAVNLAFRKYWSKREYKSSFGEKVLSNGIDSGEWDTVSSDISSLEQKENVMMHSKNYTGGLPRYNKRWFPIFELLLPMLKHPFRGYLVNMLSNGNDAERSFALSMCPSLDITPADFLKDYHHLYIQTKTIEQSFLDSVKQRNYESFFTQFSRFTGKAQRVIVDFFPQQIQDELLQICVLGHDSYGTSCKYHLVFNKGFTFSLDETKEIINILSTTSESIDYLSEFIAEYIKKDTETIQLWIDYLNSNKQNRLYAAVLLGFMKIDAALDSLVTFFKMPFLNQDYKDVKFDEISHLTYSFTAIQDIAGVEIFEKIYADAHKRVKDYILYRLNHEYKQWDNNTAGEILQRLSK